MNRQLYRSRKNRMIAGVAGGLAEYFDIDPVIARVAFVITIFGGGLGIIAYIILWIVVPERKPVFEPVTTETETGFAEQTGQEFEQTVPAEFEEKRRKRRIAAGVILIALGLLWLADNLIPQINFGQFWPLILVAIGILILINSKSKL